MRKVKYELFESDTKSWDTLCADAAAFATSVGHRELDQHLRLRRRRHSFRWRLLEGDNLRLVLGLLTILGSGLRSACQRVALR